MHLRQNRAYRLLWLASTASYLAGWIARFILPLVAVHLTRSPGLVSGVSAALTLPWLLVGLPAGVLVDRRDRRTILRCVTTLRVGALGVLAVATLLGALGLPLLYGVAFLLGVAETLAETAATALLPLLVAPAHLERANTHLVGAQQVIEAVSLPLGGALATVGLALAIGAGGLCYGVALAALLLLRGPGRAIAASGAAERRRLVTEVIDGVRVLWRQAALRWIGLMAGVINACWSAWLAVLVLYAVAPGPLRLGAAQYGLLLASSGVGGVVGAALLGPVQRVLGRRWAIGLNIIANSLMFVAPALTTTPWLIALAIVVGGIGGPLWTIAATALQQRVVPAAFQGRVGAAYRFLGLGGEALGPLVGGGVAAVWGVQAVFWGGALLTALMLLPFWRVVTEEVMV